MSTIEHPFFGPLPETDDVIWEQDIELGNGKTCDACLWASDRQALEPAALDAYVHRPTTQATTKILTCTNASPTPTAMASMLVARPARATCQMGWRVMAGSVGSVGFAASV